jgi:alkanesulfonate monooxygenase SsuD/methylene tetrahydromethanopterin reductase-like flavin-dependent oxidoreductase (luciferase family)
MEVGVLLPHFSEYATWQRLIGFAPRIEALGFSSVWVRDNLSYYGHGFELPGNTFVDPFMTLAAIAGRTERIKLGTAVAIPFRHPVVTAQSFGSLSFVSQGRVEAGLGPGTPSKPFEIVGINYADRIQLCRETAHVLRIIAKGPHASYHGEITNFDDVTIDPGPPPDMPIWYGGARNVSIRFVLEYCDGMLPGRCPFRRYDVALERLREGAAAQGRRVLAGTIPLLSIGRTREDALAKIELQPILDYLSGHWKQPFESLEDIRGAILVGSSDDIIEQIADYEARDVDTVVIDARLLMPEFEDVIEEIGERVLPVFGDASRHLLPGPDRPVETKAASSS